MSTSADRISTAWHMLGHLRITLADLQATVERRPIMPTFADYLPRVTAAASPGTHRTYGTYWQRMQAVWGDRRLDDIVATDIEALQRQITAAARVRSTSRGGRHAGELLIAAARAVYNRAIADGLIDRSDSPAHRVDKPRRLPSTRRALTTWELEAINVAARDSGNDAALDALLLRLHTETACRRGGALALRMMDVDAEHGLVRLIEKGDTLRWQPITLDLAAAMADHARSRGNALLTDQLLRYQSGQPLTTRHYDHLWHRLG